MNEFVELLFFDTFAHDNTEEINLDLVQFPKPVYVTEVRIIPLGARVQADFPGGVRLGATNPSQFKIEFFVNDLGKPGASTFESLGGFEYNQNGCINLQCTSADDSVRRIPTDGLVLKGWYSTITLAVYGTLTKNITEQIVQPTANPPVVPSQSNLIEPPQSSANRLETEWPNDDLSVPVEYEGNQAFPEQYPQNDGYQPEYQEYYNDPPKDPRNYHVENPEWNKVCSSRNDTEREQRVYEKSGNVEREHRSDTDKREREKIYANRDRSSRDYRESPRESDHDKPLDRDRGRDRSYKHDDRRSYREDKERDEKKRPRTPLLMSPKRSKTPHKMDIQDKEETEEKIKEDKPPIIEEPIKMDVEEFEPILSDEDILDDNDQYQDNMEDVDVETDDSIKIFVPGQTELIPYIFNRNYEISGDEGETESIHISENLKTTIGICDDYFKSSITKYSVNGFIKLNTEIKEEFIHLAEKLINIIDSSEKFISIVELYQNLGSENSKQINGCGLDREIRNIFSTTIDWLKVALNYKLANSQEQPIHKIRHIKCGLKLANFCFESGIFVEHLLSNDNDDFDIFQILLDLYRQEFMAPSIKLMILKALDTCLIHKNSLKTFLKVDKDEHQKGFNEKNENYYKILLEQVRCNSSVRIKFSLCSIIRKINLFEIFVKFQNLIVKLENSGFVLTDAHDIEVITTFLGQISQYLRNGFAFTQPKRFLPVSSQFEINRDDSKNVIIEFFKMFNFVESLVVLLASQISNSAIFTLILEIISNLNESEDGIEYLSLNIDSINVLLKFLVQNEDEEQYIDHLKSHSLGIMIAYKLRCLYHIKRLQYFGEKFNFDLSSLEIINEFHGLFSLTFSGNGKIAIGSIAGTTEKFEILMKFINMREKLENQFVKMKKTPGILYLIDLVHLILNYSSNVYILEKFAKEIHHLLNFEGQQEVCTNKLNSIGSFLAPIQNNSIVYDNISPFVEIIRKEIDNVIEKPEEILTCLRVIHELGVSKYATTVSENPFNNFVELKYKHVILQLYSLDGVSLINKILQKICDYYVQPSVHSSNFMSQQGLSTVEIIYPCVVLLKNLLTYAIQCRNTNFKDLTSISVLLQTYNLMFSYSIDSPHHSKCSKVKNDIVETFLVYTQPISDEIHEKDTLNKTLWSMMCKEIIQFITQAPHTFMSGLLIFSELLPLPLPIQTMRELKEADASWMISLRKLWAAHLHPHSALIQDFVNKLCTTSNQSLLNLLRRICVQISDLAANSSLMIARGILDAIYDEIQNTSHNNCEFEMCNLRMAKLLNFLACLVTTSTLKSAVLSLLQNSPNDQKYGSLISNFVRILKMNSGSSSHHVQCQECILSIIQSFCDVEISLIQNPSESSNDYLANSLPSREHLITFIDVILEHLSNENSFVTYLPAIRTLLLLTEHNYGFYHLRENLLKKSRTFTKILQKLCQHFSKDNPDCISILNTLIEFFYVSVIIEDCVVEQINHSPRTMKMSLTELKNLLGWFQSRNGDKHSLELLKDLINEGDASFEGLHEKITNLINLLSSNSSESADALEFSYSEQILPNPEPILTQFSRRIIFNNSDTFNERLTAEYWLSVPTNEESEIENVNIDLSDIAKQNFSNDYNLIHEIEVLCRISSANLLNDKEKKINDAQKMKKPLVSPLRTRGFPRIIQQRPDLFRSRPPNTSRPPSLHVDDFVALETCGAQPTGPTGYNKISRELMVSRSSRGVRGSRAAFSERAAQYRQMSWWGSNFGRLPY